MKIVCDREKLLGAFQTAATVAPSRSPKPILQNIKMTVSDQGAMVMATDLEVGIRIDVPGGDVEAPGEPGPSKSGRDRRRSGDLPLFRRSLCQLSYPTVSQAEPGWLPGSALWRSRRDLNPRPLA